MNDQKKPYNKGNRKSGSKSKKDTSMAGRTKRGNSNSNHNYRGSDSGVERTVSYTHNDPSWYSLNPEITSSVTKVPFAPAVGQHGVIPDIWPFTPVSQGSTVPSCMTFYTYMAPGYSADLTSPINVAAQKFYTYIRKNMSVYASYEACDLMLMLMAMNSAWEYHGWMTKALGLINTYSAQNTDIPDLFIKSMGIDPVDLRRHYTDLWGWISIFSNRMESFVTPKDMTFTKRRIHMVTNIFADDDANNYKSQFYHFVPACFFKFDGYASETGGRLTPIGYPRDRAIMGANNPSEYLTVDEIIKIGEEMIQALGDQDIRAMSGDILKAIGEENVMRLPTVPIDVRVASTYDPYMLLQIANANICNHNFEYSMEDYFDGHPDFADKWAIRQNGAHGAVLFTPITDSEVELGPGNKYKFRINVKADMPTEADVLEATRLMSYLGDVSDASQCVGSEIITDAVIWDTSENDTITPKFLTTQLVCGTVNPDNQGATINSAFPVITYLSSFEHHPAVTLLYQMGDKSYVTAGTLGEVDNLTYLELKAVARIHYAALMKMFDIPNAMV